MREGRSLQRYAADFAAFVDDIVIPSASGPARFGDCMASFQRERFAALAPALQAVAAGIKPEIGRYWWEATKGASKDSDLAVALVWLLAFARRALTCQVGASDQDQASEVRKVVADLLRLNEWLGGMVEVQNWAIVNTRTGSRCEIIAADVAGSHGARPDVLIVNELSHIPKQEFAENLMDNAAKVPRGLVVIATNAGFVGGWQWAWREAARVSPRWSFHKFADVAPWIDQDEIEEARQRNAPSRFARLWQGVWASGTGDALASDWIDRAVVLVGPAAGRELGWSYAGGLDVGLRHDRTGLVVVARHVNHTQRIIDGGEPAPCSRMEAILRDIGGPEFHQRQPEVRATYKEVEATNKVKLVYSRTWRPSGAEVDLDAVEQAIVEVHNKFRLRSLLADEWQAAALLQSLRRRGIPAEATTFSGGNLNSMACELLACFREAKVELYDDPDLLADLRSASIVEKLSGVRVEFQRDDRGHGDCGQAFLLALLAARRLRRPGPPKINRPLVIEAAGDGRAVPEEAEAWGWR